VVGIYPDAAALLRLATSLLVEQNDCVSDSPLPLRAA
jgi:hypothetical protein